MRRTLAMVAAFGCLLSVAVTLAAQPGGKGPGGFPFGPGKKKGGGFDEGIPTAGMGPQKITRWEYHVANTRTIADLGKESFDSGLNMLGADGWELIAVESSGAKGAYAKYIFRRPAGVNIHQAPPAKDPAPKEKTEARLELRMYALKNAVAADAATLLGDVLRFSTRDPMRMSADPRTNQVVVNATPQAHAEIEAILQRLDVATAEREPGAPRGPGGTKKKFDGFPK